MAAAIMSFIAYALSVPIVVNAINELLANYDVTPFYQVVGNALALIILTLPFVILGAVTYWYMELVQKFEGVLRRALNNAKVRRIREKQEKRGVGGVYEI